MGLAIGIDTGGTYTDAVLFDVEARTVIAQGKARTTKGDLSVGICNALDNLPLEQAKQANVVALSTTLATNACVEGKGGRAKVVLVGTNENVLKRIGASKKYGFALDDALCIDESGSSDGKVVVQPNWEAFMDDNAEVLSQAQGFGIAEIYAGRNGAVVEREGARALKERFGVPVIMASSLVSGLNMMERGATAVLNARLLPVIEEFLDATAIAMRERGIEAPIMVVRSDGSLMNEAFSRQAPVETMVSGPAASVQGARELAPEASEMAIIVDMGGTTSDISLVEDGRPVAKSGIRIGNWRTQVSGVLVDTFGLGGDSLITWENGNLALSDQRVEPLCMACSRWPELEGQLEKLVAKSWKVFRPLYDVLYLVREPQENLAYNEREQRLLALLRTGPVMIAEQSEFDYFELERGHVPARLEAEGIVMRCSLTPTDIMHIRGDFTQFNARASLLAVQYLAELMPMYNEGLGAVEPICDVVYSLVKRKLYANIVRVLLEYAHPEQFLDGLPDQLERAIVAEWDTWCEKDGAGALLTPHLAFSTQAPIVGLGAPIHVFLPDVAKALGTTCVIPHYAQVANAVGAAVASVSGKAEVRIRAEWSSGGIDGYIVNEDGNRLEFATYEEALAAASDIASEQAKRVARERGAVGDLEVTVSTVDDRSASSGVILYFGSVVTATAHLV